MLAGTSPWCDTKIGHFGKADFGDAMSHVLVTITQGSSANTLKVSFKPASDNPRKLTYIWVNWIGKEAKDAGKSDGSGNYDELSVEFTYSAGTKTANIEFQWAHNGWAGRWCMGDGVSDGCKSITVNLDDTCGAAPTEPSITTSTDNLKFLSSEPTPRTKTFTVTGTNLTDKITIASNSSNFSVSPSEIVADGPFPATVTVTCSATADENAQLTISSVGAESETKYVDLSYSTYTPKEIEFTNSSKILGAGAWLYIKGLGSTYTKDCSKFTFDVSSTASGLAFNRCNDGNADFIECIFNIGIPDASTDITTIKVTYENGDTGTITFKGTKILNPSMSVTPTEWICMAQGATKEFTVTAEALKQDISITSSSANFTVNKSSISKDATFPQTFIVTCATFAADENETITLSTSGAENKVITIQTQNPEPVMSISPSELSLNGKNKSGVITLSAQYLTSDVTVTSDDGAFTVDRESITKEEANDGDVQITVTSNAAGDATATITIESGTLSKQVNVTYTAPKEIVFDYSQCSILGAGIKLYFNGYGSTYSTDCSDYTFNVECSDPSFTYNRCNPVGTSYMECILNKGLDPTAQSGLITKVTLTYINGDTGSITFKGTKVLNPSMSVSPTSWICMAQGATKEFTVTAEALKQDISITSSSANFTVNKSSISKDATFPQTFIVTCATFAADENETITLSTSGAENKVITIQTQNPEPTMSVSPSELSLNGKHKSGVITLSAQYLTSDVSVYSNDGAFTVDKGTITKDEANAGDVEITVTSNAAGDATATITIESGTLSEQVEVTYTAPKEIVFKDGCFIDGAQLHLMFDGYGTTYDKDITKYEVSISSTLTSLTGVTQQQAQADRLYYVMNAAPRKDGAEIDMTTVTLTYDNGDTGTIMFKGWERYIPQPFNHGLYDAENATVTTDFHSSGWGEDTESSAEIVGDGDVKVNIVPAKNEIWQGQVKLQTGITTLDPSKVYSLSFKMKSTKNCGGVTIKMFDDHAMLYGERAITLTANTEYVYNMTDIVNTYTLTNGVLVFDFGYAAANTDIEIYDIAIFAEEASVFTELFDIEEASICKVWSPVQNPVATIDVATGTINVKLKAQQSGQWNNQVHVCTGIKKLNPNAEYKFKFTAVASTNDCGGVTFKAFDDNELVYRNQDIVLNTTSYNYESDWIKPNNLNTAGAMVFDFGWDPVQNITISNISILEKVKAVQNESQDKSYSTLADAIEEAASGDKIVVNVDLGESVTLDKYIKLNGNGKSVGDITIDLTGKLEITGATNFNTLIVKSKPNVGAGQVFTSDAVSATASEVYAEREFRDSFQQLWYSLALPFACDAASGLYNTNGTQITKGVWFNEYNSQKRADTGLSSGNWDFVTSLSKGTAYMIYMNEGINAVRFKATNPNDIFALTTSIPYNKYDGSADAEHHGWNFMAQPMSSNAWPGVTEGAWGYIQVLHNGGATASDGSTSGQYTTESVVGTVNIAPYTAFMFQASADGNMNFTASNGEAVIKSAEYEEVSYFKVTLSDANGNSDATFVSASEYASATEYEIGKDLVKCGSSSAFVQITTADLGLELTVNQAKAYNGEATIPLLLNCPVAGSYAISVAEMAEIGDIYLLHNGTVVCDLGFEGYAFNVSEKQLNKEYSLLIKLNGGIYTDADGAVENSIYAKDRVIYVNGIYATDVTNIAGQSVGNPVPEKGVYVVEDVKISVE
ncbi:MAG: hypothetical protein MJ003_05975 [Paludibacteraceae bacterium]|nr:hypothetical protein [Paludibacteraceae bacterium]